MGLVENARELARVKEDARSTGRRCKAVKIADQIPAGPERDEYWELVADTKTFTAADIAKLLEMSGVTVSSSSIAEHRSGRCQCGRAAQA